MSSVEVHRTHCCVHHYCKYGSDHCPVVKGEVVQAYPCEFCDDDKNEAAHTDLPYFVSLLSDEQKEELRKLLG